MGRCPSLNPTEKVSRALVLLPLLTVGAMQVAASFSRLRASPLMAD